jgi:hypothetical protein
MTAEKSFTERIADLQEEVHGLGEDGDDALIEATARRLEGVNFTPPVITPLARFLRLRKEGVLAEIDRILAMPEAEACALAPGNSSKCEDLRVQYITVIVYHYRKILALRHGSPEEWDEVDELYVHD